MQTAHDKLLALLADLVKIDRLDIQLAKELFEPILAFKGDTLVEAGTTARYLYFVNSGYLRNYYYEDGEEITTQLNCTSGFMTSFNSFITQTHSHYYLECITDCSLLRVSKKDIDTLYQHSQKWSEFGMRIYEQSFVSLEQRTKDMISLSAEQRYLKLMNEHPDFIQHIPLQYLASYLGIKAPSLSRIRKNLVS